MKTISKFIFALLATFSLAGCADIANSKSNVNTSAEAKPDVAVDAYLAEANKITKVDYKKATITYSIKEKITGTFPMLNPEGGDMPVGTEVTSSLVIEDNGDGFFRTVSGATSSKMRNLSGGYNLYIVGWCNYQENIKKTNEGYEGKYYLNPFEAWMKITATRPGLGNATYEGDYLGSEETDLLYGSNGYCTSITLKSNETMKGTLTNHSTGSRVVTNYDGSYSATVTATIAYEF